MSVKTTVEYQSGYEAKILEIKESGWKAARDEFNRRYAPGQQFTGSPEEYKYLLGEFQALCDKMNSYN